MSKFDGRNDQLPRLEREYYRGQSYVHWTLTIQDRRTGWLIPTFYYKFTACLIPGYPELELWQDDYWPRFWRTYYFLRKNGLFRPFDKDLSK